MLTILLDNLRSKHNVGAIFRTADAAGVSRVILCGTTPQPVDRFGRPVEAIKKTALGAETTVSYEYNPDTKTAVRDLQDAGTSVWVVEQSELARDIIFDHDLVFPQPIVFVFGHEVDGVQPSVLEMADQVVSLPMLGTKESLNVSVTVGIVLYCFRSKMENRSGPYVNQDHREGLLVDKNLSNEL